MQLIYLLIFSSSFGIAQSSSETSNAFEDDSNHIFIFGKRKSPPPIGQNKNQQSYKINSEDQEHASQSEIYRQQASIVIPAQDFGDPIRILMPKIRLQDTKLNEIYLNNFVLIDPQSSLQDMRGFDLKSMGAMDVFYGQSPTEFHSQSPSGLIHFYPTEHFGKYHSLVSSYAFSMGQEYALRYAWNRNVQHKALRNSYIFGRRFLSKGDYTFYDSNQTPYETSDDKRSRRRNNAAASGQVLSMFQVEGEVSEFTWLASLSDHKQDLGTDLLGVDSFSSKFSMQRMHRVSYSKKLNLSETSWILNPKLSLAFLWNEQQSTTTDPSRSFLVNSEYLKTTSEQQMAEMRIEWKFSSFYLLGTYRRSIFESVNEFDLSEETSPFKRDLQKTGLSFSWTPSQRLQWDAKYIFAEKNSQSNYLQKSQAPYVSSSLSYELFGGVRPYIQWSHSQRFPSVLEEQGDGGYFQAGENLRNEEYLHREVGANISIEKFATTLSSAYYVDDTKQKILWLPSSFGSYKAQNISQTKIQGADFSLFYQTKKLDFSLSQAWSKALDFGDNQETAKVLAFSPEWIRVASISWKPIRSLKIGSDLRYQSSFFLDRQERVKLGEHWTQNLYVHGYPIVLSDTNSSSLSLSLKVINLWNSDSQSISAYGQDEGRVSVSEFPGYPSPSRSFSLHTEYVF